MKNFFIASIFLFSGINSFGQKDHSEYIEGPFEKPQDITETCLMCHEGVDKDIMKTRHWNWLGDEFTNRDGEKMKLGKQNIINNFCIGVSSNWARCTSCHIGYGWKDNSFDFNEGKNIDCLICHDQTGTYKKTPTGAGMPDPSVDLVKVAQSVGLPKNENCSVCHFNGGGGTGVKHGDMDGSMVNPSAELDVHMGQFNFNCTSCHAGKNHKILGASHGSMASGQNHISCIDCHKETPHEKSTLNKHVKSVACETCHIPAFAREEATKTWWDWSAAGEDREVTKDEFGFPTYDKKKGEFVWSKNVIPEYRWYNGQADYYNYGDKLNPSEILSLNELSGNINDNNAKITPFKLMHGKQIYDSKNNYLIVPKLFGKDGYWSTFNWNSASELGMQSINVPYSGEYAFIETEMFWPINHMVAPAKDALKCADCHNNKESQRLDWEKLGYNGDPIKQGGRFKEKD